MFTLNDDKTCRIGKTHIDCQTHDKLLLKADYKDSDFSFEIIRTIHQAHQIKIGKMYYY